MAYPLFNKALKHTLVIEFHVLFHSIIFMRDVLVVAHNRISITERVKGGFLDENFL